MARSAPLPGESSCDAASLDPVRLSATWPTLVGRPVRFAARVERMLELTEALVVARNRRFVVTMPPDRIWEGNREQAFVVMGSKTVRIDGGGVTLPELLLAQPCGTKP